MFSDVREGERCVYRLSPDEAVDTLAGSYPAAYFDRYDQAPAPAG